MKATVALAVALVPMASLAGQTVAGRAVIAAPSSSVRLPDLSERLEGVWLGLILEVSVGRLSASAAGTRGWLTPVGVGNVLNRDVGEVSLSGRYEGRSGYGIEGRYVARGFSSAAGYQRWDIVGVGATAARDLGTPAVRAIAKLAYLPIVNLREQGRASFGVSSEVALTIAPRRLPIAFLMSYRIERFSFFKLARREQFEAFSLSVGLPARRAEGR